MIFKRYKFIIRFALIAVSLVSLMLFYWQFHSQYQYEIAVFKNRFQEEVTQIDNTLKTATDYVEQIQLQANSFYATAQVGYAESLLLDSLQPQLIDDLPYYSLDQIPEPYSPQEVGNLTGFGTLSDRASSFYQELEMAFSLNPILQTARKTIGNGVFAYYISTEQFINRAPWMPSQQFHFEPKLLKYESLTLAKPANNPERQQFWTAAYLDTSNINLIVTYGAPVYDGAKFQGTVALDLRLDFLTQILKRLQWQAGQSFLLNNRHQVLGYVDSQADSDPQSQLVWSTDDVLTPTLQDQIQAIATSSTASILEQNGNLVVFQRLHQAPWQLVYVAPKATVILPLLFRLGVGWGLLILGLILSLLIADRLITREFIAPANQLIAHIRSLNQQTLTPIPDVPDDWRPWFETISEIFDANQKMTAQLVQKEKMSSLGQLVAGIAHEINNPVNFIYGNLSYVHSYSQDLLELIELYAQETPKPSLALQEKLEDMDLEFVQDDLQNIVRSMETGADRIRDIVVSLRSFSQLDEMGEKQVDLQQGMENTLMILERRLEGIVLCQDYQETPKIRGYASQLNQVFLNLLNNAIDALEERETETKNINISIESVLLTYEGAVNAAVLVTIADNGMGMTPEIQDRVLNPFFTTKPVGKGTGLGLPICYQIVVEQHYGEFEIESQPGVGTTVKVTLPIAPPALRCDLPLSFATLTTDSPPT